MEYIFDIIKKISEYGSLWILAIVVLFFIKYYKQKEEEEHEEYLVLKMIGYYMLGLFTFNLNGFIAIPIVIPVGFIVYYTTMMEKEKRNTVLKHKCAVLGFLMIWLGILNGIIYQSLEYRTQTIKEYTGQIDELEEVWTSVEKRLKLHGDSQVMDFRMDYDTEKNIQSMTLRFTNSSQDGKLFTLNGNFEGKLTVDVSKYITNDEFISMYPNYYYSVNVDELIKLVSNLEFKKSPSENGKIISSYYITYDASFYGTSITSEYSNGAVYLIESVDDDFKDIKYRKAKEREFPIEGVLINYSPMEKISITEEQEMSEGLSTDTYVLYPMINESLIKESTEKLEVKNIKENKTITLIDYDYRIEDIINSLEFYTWEETDLKDIEGEPYLKLEDSLNNSVIIYDNNYVLYKSIDEELVYKIEPSIIESVIEQINIINN